MGGGVGGVGGEGGGVGGWAGVGVVVWVRVRVEVGMGERVGERPGAPGELGGSILTSLCPCQEGYWWGGRWGWVEGGQGCHARSKCMDHILLQVHSDDRTVTDKDRDQQHTRQGAQLQGPQSITLYSLDGQWVWASVPMEFGALM